MSDIQSNPHTALNVINEVCALQKKILYQTRQTGYIPHPDLNPLFEILLSIVNRPYSAAERSDIIHSITSPPFIDQLKDLRKLCWLCEMELEKNTIRLFPERDIPQAHNLSIQERISAFENFIRASYPYDFDFVQRYPHYQTQLFNNNAAEAKCILLCGPGSMPFLQLYWIWMGEERGQDITIISLDPDKEQAELGQSFIDPVTRAGFIKPDAVRIRHHAPDLDVSSLIRENNITAAQIMEYPSAADKESVIRQVQNSPLSTFTFTYPDGLVQLLYEPVDLSVLDHPDWRLSGCLLSSQSEGSVLPSPPQILSPEKDETLWLSSYCCVKA